MNSFDLLWFGIGLLLALLTAATQPQNQMKSRLLLDVVVRESSAVLKLLSRKDEPLLIWRNAFLVLNFLLHIFDGVTRLHIEGDCFAREGLDEDLHVQPPTWKITLLQTGVKGISGEVRHCFHREERRKMIGSRCTSHSYVTVICCDVKTRANRLHVLADII